MEPGFAPRPGIETYTEYPTRDDDSLGIAWSDEWAETTNSCQRSWSLAGDPEFRTIECDRHERSTTEHWSELETDRQPRLDRVEHGEWTYAGKIPGCTITSGNDGGDDNGNGSEREEANNGWDIDGDGRADFEDIDDAKEEMEKPGDFGESKTDRRWLRRWLPRIDQSRRARRRRFRQRWRQ